MRVEYGPAAHREVYGIWVIGPFAHRAHRFGLNELDTERIGEAGDKLDLQFAQLAALALEPVGPNMRAGLGRDQLRVDLDVLADSAHAAFEQIAYAEVAPDLLGVDRLALVREGGAAGDDEGVL